MRPIRVRQSAAGFTAWVPVNRLQVAFDIGLAVIVSSGASLVATVQHTFDDIYAVQGCSISRTTTVATLTLTNHGLSVNDWVYVTNSGSSNLDGFYNVASVVDANNITYTVANSGATASGPNVLVQIARVFNHLTLHDLTANMDGNYISPVMAIRLNLTTWVSGFADLDVLQGLGQ